MFISEGVILNKFIKTIKSESFITIFLCAFLPLFILGIFVIPFYADRSIKKNVTKIQSQAQLIVNQIRTTGYLENPTIEFINTELVALGNAYSGRILITDSSLNVVKDTYGIDEGKTILWENAISSLNGNSNTFYDKKNSVVIVTVPIYSLTNETEASNSDNNALSLTPSKKVAGILIITHSIDDILQDSIFIRNLILDITLIVSVLGIVVAIVMSNKFSNQIKKLGEYIHSVRETKKKINYVPKYMELKAALSEFEKFKEKTESLEQSRQEFVSNVSHELKTPLASVKVLADSLTSFPDAPIDMYKEFMTDITAEIDRETKIINDLLSLVKLDRKAAALNIEQISLNDMIESILKMLKPLAEKSGVDLVIESFRPVMCDADPVKLSLAIMNLVENGIKYNKKNGAVHVTLNSDKNYAYIRVEDTGIGMPKDALNHIFERFYRVDKSHSKEIGGTGLGLSIVKEIIALHGGEIKVSSIEDIGSVFDIRMPLRYVSDNGPLVESTKPATVESRKPAALERIKSVVEGKKPIVKGDNSVVEGKNPVVKGDNSVVEGKKPVEKVEISVIEGKKPVDGGIKQ